MSNGVHLLQEYTERLKKQDLIAESTAAESISQKKVAYVSYNSQDVKQDTLFICKGAHFKEAYLKAAMEKGAFAYISERKYEEAAAGAPCIIVRDMRKTIALVADLFYNQAWKELTLIGITGTKGKSTTAYFMRFILDCYLESQRKPNSAVISSIDTYDGVVNEESHITTPEALDLHRHYDNAVRSGIPFLTMEVSSQALKYDRTLGVTFDVGCFLNIGRDHISAVEHPDFEDYLKSKMILFTQCQTACINLDDHYADMAIAAARRHGARVVTFGKTEQADVYGYAIKRSGQGISFRVKSDSFDEAFKIGMSGLFNVENALAAIAICHSLNIPLEAVQKGLAEARVSGRMEIFTDKNGRLPVIVDYAHNQMSFEALFTSTKEEYPGKKITIVFGCPGNKALGRRKELGELAGKYADKAYLTEEDAGEEPVLDIAREIAAHVGKYNCQCEIITDREEAIRQAIRTAGGDTIVLITGKGRETRQKRGTQYVDTPSDVDYVEAFLAEE